MSIRRSGAVLAIDAALTHLRELGGRPASFAASPPELAAQYGSLAFRVGLPLEDALRRAVAALPGPPTTKRPTMEAALEAYLAAMQASELAER